MIPLEAACFAMNQGIVMKKPQAKWDFWGWLYGTGQGSGGSNA